MNDIKCQNGTTRILLEILPACLPVSLSVDLEIINETMDHGITV